ncbi:tRNA dihydrouridine(20/20a) synthase DusA [Notoacmeibacter sp. MSK16QG-6]|uniref:tRNA dihydrouridine(20/20a) synthase DusA n=1 Tax=Notoacmeibacter sp. MSK16QG-6 TaxID=2957982 RepID=UPI00209D0A54|nr:tRNA dihydrouridine(20/20a) synthase DusA [Notoacmeibacter sp. MSK16QG-6]MCP1199497.1 tRNA dihydrouridine(20/20a) synthase DusA [Notoacmeibacter sp. MSK16QG-6]
MTLSDARKFAIAPMIDWTDRHCRYFHRQLTCRALLYTEMVVADAIIHGDRERLLGHDETEHTLALQIGGSDPVKLAEATRIGVDFGYDEINLNVGCPSDRVQSGAFGACLMRDPALVQLCVQAMKEAAAGVPVTVKCRIGVDDQTPEEVLPDFARRMRQAGADALWVHARKAWLQGLSPKENRTVPPLDYPLVHGLKKEHPDWFIGINGGITEMNAVRDHLTIMDGVMVGRKAYSEPGFLTGVDTLFGEAPFDPDWPAIIEAMMDYSTRHIARGGRLSAVTRHMVGLFAGLPGARRWRQILSTEATQTDAASTVIAKAFAAVSPHLEGSAPASAVA